MACGGVNFLGDPKTDCWRLDFSSSRPRWTDMAPLTVPRDAAAWAAEGGKLYVMGGNLGPLSGYTDNVEVYDPTSEEWTVRTPCRDYSCKLNLRWVLASPLAEPLTALWARVRGPLSSLEGQ